MADGVEYRFNHWSTLSSALSVSNPDSPSTTLTVKGDGVLTAVYEEAGSDGGGGNEDEGGDSQPKTYTLTISVSPLSGGTTSPAPGTYEYEEGASVTVRAYSNSGYRFAYWLLDGERAGTSPTITVVMDGDHALTAVFESTSLDYYHRYVVKEVKAYVHYSNAFGEILDAKSEKLLPFEYFIVLVEVEVEDRVTTRTGTGRHFYYPVDVNIRVTVPNDFCKYLVKYDQKNPVIEDETKTVIRTERNCRTSFTEKFGVWIVKRMNLSGGWRDYTITVEYSWSNTYGDSGSGTISKQVRICSAKPELKFIPITPDLAEVRIYLKWVDDNTYVYGRTYLRFFLNDTQLPETRLDEDGRTLVYRELSEWELKPPYLYARYLISDSLDHLTDAIVDTWVYYTDLAIVVLARYNYTVRLEVCEFGYNTSIKVPSAVVKLVAVNLENGEIA